MSTFGHKALWWAPSMAYMALIWTLSSIPKIMPIQVVPLQDKWIHLVEYAVLAVLYGYAMVRTWPGFRKWSILLLAGLAAAIWGVIDETHQAFVPNRYSDAMDAIADTLGAFIGAGIYLGFLSFKKKSSKQS